MLAGTQMLAVLDASRNICYQEQMLAGIDDSRNRCSQEQMLAGTLVQSLAVDSLKKLAHAKAIFSALNCWTFVATFWSLESNHFYRNR